MNVRYSTAEHPFLCFKHAVQEAMKDVEVDQEVESDEDNEYDMRQSWCSLCNPELEDRG